jgi:hypothetical protein
LMLRAPLFGLVIGAASSLPWVVLCMVNSPKVVSRSPLLWVTLLLKLHYGKGWDKLSNVL